MKNKPASITVCAFSQSDKIELAPPEVVGRDLEWIFGAMMHCMTVGDGRKWVKRPEGLGRKLWAEKQQHSSQSSREISTGQTTMTGVSNSSTQHTFQGCVKAEIIFSQWDPNWVDFCTLLRIYMLLSGNSGTWDEVTFETWNSLVWSDHRLFHKIGFKNCAENALQTFNLEILSGQW